MIWDYNGPVDFLQWDDTGHIGPVSIIALIHVIFSVLI